MKILIADDHALIRSGLRCELAELAVGMAFVEASDADSLRRQLQAHADLDLALVDLGMPGMQGAESISALRDAHPAIPLVVLSASDGNDEVRAVLRAGAAGFIPKAAMPQVMLPALRLVLAGGRYLPPQLLAAGGDTAARTPAPASSARAIAGTGVPSDAAAIQRGLLSARQKEVFALLARGLSNKAIARELRISEATVKSHVATIFDLLQVHNRVSAVAQARKLSEGQGNDSATS